VRNEVRDQVRWWSWKNEVAESGYLIAHKRVDRDLRAHPQSVRDHPGMTLRWRWIGSVEIKGKGAMTMMTSS